MPITLWILTGPTACGKSDIAVKIAETIGAEIVSADSMLVYRGMNIGTEKPSHEIRERIPHYLIDVVDPWEEYSVGRYLKDFESVIENLRQRNKPFVIVGGTALYLKVIINGLFEGPSADWEYRDYLKSIVLKNGFDFLHKMLTAVDPETASKLHSNDHRRIIRALEVYKKTGDKISSFQTQFGKANAKYNCIIVAINYERNVLYHRIEARVDRMFQRGLINEVQGLLSNSLGLSKQSSQALGYKEIIDYFNGKYTLPEVIALIKRNTRRFAKRQITWFRSFPNVHWINAHIEDDVRCLTEKVIECFTQNEILFKNVI